MMKGVFLTQGPIQVGLDSGPLHYDSNMAGGSKPIVTEGNSKPLVSRLVGLLSDSKSGALVSRAPSGLYYSIGRAIEFSTIGCMSAVNIRYYLCFRLYFRCMESLHIRCIFVSIPDTLSPLLSIV